MQHCLYQTLYRKSFPRISPRGKVKPDFFPRWQGEVCFLRAELVSELLPAAFVTSTLLARGQKTPILGFPPSALSSAELCPVGFTCEPCGSSSFSSVRRIQSPTESTTSSMDALHRRLTSPLLVLACGTGYVGLYSQG